MTKSTGTGRGGVRKGAGRKPKVIISQARKPEVLVAAAARVERMAKSNGGPASALAPLAYATLEQVMTGSPFDAPRVSAARAIIELAKAETSAPNAVKLGKKEVAAQEAELAGGAGSPWGDDLVLPKGLTN